MWLISSIKSYLGWAFSIGRRMTVLAGPQIVVVVVAAIISQLARVLAFLLPLKIVLLMGSSHVPDYFPGPLQDFEPEMLVVGLGLAALGFYGLYAIAEKVLVRFTEQSAERVLAYTAKLALFPQQDQIVSNVCRRMAESIAAAIFGILATALLAWLFPVVAAVMVGWILAALVAVGVLGSWSATCRAWLEKNADKAVEVVSTLGFFIVVSTIVGMFIAGTRFTILFAIIAVLLARQVLQRTSTIFTNALNLYPRQRLINTLFLRGHSWPSNAAARSKSVWDLFTADPQCEWLPQTLADITGREVAEAGITGWHEAGLFDVVTFEVAAKGDSPEGYLVKVFDRARSLAAMQEAALLGSIRDGVLPAPAFLGSALVEEHHCHVFEMPQGRPLTPAEFAQTRLDLVVDCWTCRPPADLVRRFRRTHQLVGQRLARTDFERLKLLARNAQELADIDAFRGMLEEMCDTLDQLPLVITVPDLRAEIVLRLPDGRHAILSWGRWKLEPVGAGWAVDSENLSKLPDWLEKAGAVRREIAEVAPEKAQLAALLSELERLLSLQRYRAALEFLPTILHRGGIAAADGPLPVRNAS